MAIPTTAPRSFAPLFGLERARLLGLLRALEPADWRRPTPCPGWDVLGLAAHLAGGDFAWLSGQRDAHYGTPAPSGLDEGEFVAWLDAMQAEWVHAARRLSPRLVVDLLAWTDDQVAGVVASRDPSVPDAHVSWASREAVPRWLDHGRELTERWIHRQQILEACGEPSDLRRDLAEPVLDTLRWAYSFRLRPHRRPLGARVVVRVAGREFNDRWDLLSDGSSWAFVPAGQGRPIAGMSLTDEQAWRLLTNNYRSGEHGAIETHGDADVVGALVRTRAIIGTPK